MNSPASAVSIADRKVILLGPQRLAPIVGEVARRVGVSGRAAVVTAGWQEREREDDELLAALGLPGRNLELYHRWEDVARADPSLFAAHRARQDQLRALEELYDLRLGYALGAARELLAASAPPALLAVEQASAIDAVRALDQHHLAQVRAIHERFERDIRPGEHPALAAHRREIAALLEDVEVLVIAGGHVGVLLNRLRLFDLGAMIGRRHVVAWSAGAMACCEQIALFHDSPPQGAGNAEVYELGLGVVAGVIALPHARRRLRVHDPVRVRLMASRLWPARPLVLDERCWVAFDSAGRVLDGDGVRQFERDGGVRALLPAAISAAFATASEEPQP